LPRRSLRLPPRHDNMRNPLLFTPFMVKPPHLVIARAESPWRSTGPNYPKRQNPRVLRDTIDCRVGLGSSSQRQKSNPILFTPFIVKNITLVIERA
jgi:hypothetical protein